MRASNAAKVAFVSGNDGATFGEVNAIVFVVFAAACVCARMRRVVVTHDDGVDVALGFVLAYAGLAAMFAPELARSVAGVAFAGCLATWPLARRWRDASTRPSHIETSVLREGVTTYRFVLTTLTITAILAIDFDLFPRRLGKTETYGLSLMDIGGGSYVFSSGFVSSLARFGEENRRGRKFQKRGGFLALVALGVARLAATAAVGYHTVESEYGRYWNFSSRWRSSNCSLGGTARWRRLDGNGDRGDVSVRSLGKRRRARRVDIAGSERESASAGS